MSLNLTDISEKEYAAILYGNMSPKMAADYLRQKRVCVRSFYQTIQEMFPDTDLLKKLVDFYQELQPDSRRPSIRKKIRYWLHEHNGPNAREDFFRVAFALGMDEKQLNFLLGICTDYAIQYRDAREAVLAWYLRNGMTYSEAIAFLSDLPEIPKYQNTFSSLLFHTQQNTRGIYDPEASAEDYSADSHPQQIASLSASYGVDQDSDMTVLQRRENVDKSFEDCKRYVANITRVVYQEFSLAKTREELRDCYLRNLDRFGEMHLKAYYYFDQYLDLLISPASLPGQSEPDYSIETVMNKYLLLHMPSSRKRSNYSVVQKLVKESWPNATGLKNIRNHVDDVPRKLLLLLYVITENSDAREEYREIDEGYVSLEERVEDHWWTLNAMLAECGLAPLDLRNAFDWLILYAICTDGEEAMRDRLEGVIDELFRDTAI